VVLAIISLPTKVYQLIIANVVNSAGASPLLVNSVGAVPVGLRRLPKTEEFTKCGNLQKLEGNSLLPLLVNSVGASPVGLRRLPKTEEFTKCGNLQKLEGNSLLPLLINSVGASPVLPLWGSGGCPRQKSLPNVVIFKN